MEEKESKTTMGMGLKMKKERRRMCVKDDYRSDKDFVLDAENCVSGLCPG